MGEPTEWGESAQCQGGFHTLLRDDLGPVKGTTRSLLPLLHSKPWEDPNQRCLEEPKNSISAEHWPIICKGLSCPGLQEEKGPKSVM